MLYAEQKDWVQLQAFLPNEMHFTKDYQPSEEWWNWKGHRIHLDRFKNPNAKVRVILFHGVGTNGRQMSMILGGPLFKRGFETVSIDMPGYGMTDVAPKTVYSYNDWVQIGADFIESELAKDSRPIVLYGLSAGGMLTYHVAALSRRVKGIVGMTFLDQRNQQVRDESFFNVLISRLGVPLASFASKTPLAGLKMPMRLAGKMFALVNDKAALKLLMKDRTSAGSWASMRFLSTYTFYQPEIEPEDFSICPILLTQPAADRWTPLHLAKLFLTRIKKVKVTTVLLENAGHYPLEQPGIQQMQDAIVEFIGNVA